MNKAAHAISLISLSKSSSSFNTSNRDLAFFIFKWARNLFCEWNGTRPFELVAIHSTPRNFRTSARKFWLNGLCPKLLFLWSWVGGILRILQSDWFREQAVFSYLLTTVMVTNYAKRRVKLRIERAKFQFVLIIFCNRAVLLFNFLIKNKGFWWKLSQWCHLLTHWWDNV